MTFGLSSDRESMNWEKSLFGRTLSGYSVLYLYLVTISGRNLSDLIDVHHFFIQCLEIKTDFLRLGISGSFCFSVCECLY